MECNTDPVCTGSLLHQIKDQCCKLFTHHRVTIVTMPSQPFDYNLLLFATEKLLGFMSNRRGFATFQAIGDGGGRNVELFCGITK